MQFYVALVNQISSEKKKLVSFLQPCWVTRDITVIFTFASQVQNKKCIETMPYLKKQ